jgi:Cu/Ag efflux pump CusA
VLLAEMRKAVATIPGVSVSFGQPISHRIDHMISGSKTNLAVKIFGPDLYVAFRSHRHTLIVLIHLPLALIGGLLAVAASGDGLSVASLVGFITLFGIATRNGVLLVSHYEHLMREEGMPLREAVVRGSHERLAPVLMTALTAGLALIPLVLAGDKPGNSRATRSRARSSR